MLSGTVRSPISCIATSLTFFLFPIAFPTHYLANRLPHEVLPCVLFPELCSSSLWDLVQVCGHIQFLPRCFCLTDLQKCSLHSSTLPALPNFVLKAYMWLTFHYSYTCLRMPQEHSLCIGWFSLYPSTYSIPCHTVWTQYLSTDEIGKSIHPNPSAECQPKRYHKLPKLPPFCCRHPMGPLDICISISKSSHPQTSKGTSDPLNSLLTVSQLSTSLSCSQDYIDLEQPPLSAGWWK